MAPDKKIKPRNKVLNETLMARSRGGGSGVHKNSMEKRGKSKFERYVASELLSDAYEKGLEQD